MNELLQSERGQSQTDENTGFVLDVVKSDDSSIHPHDLYIAVVRQHKNGYERVKWLDVGCGWHLDWPWELEREQELLRGTSVCGIDPDWQAITRHRSIRRRVVGIIETLPYASCSFDLVSANVVVEHLKDPGLAFREVLRVLRPGGAFVFRTPSARSHFVRIARRLPQGVKLLLASRVIERRKAEDIYPAYYLANTPDAIGDICKSVGFRRVSVTITKARGILGRFPRLNRVEKFLAARLSNCEGTLIVEARK